MLEQGSGALPEKKQAMLHVQDIARTDGKEAAEAMYRRLAIYYGATPTVVPSRHASSIDEQLLAVWSLRFDGGGA
jgi:hypothetical protein